MSKQTNKPPIPITFPFLTIPSKLSSMGSFTFVASSIEGHKIPNLKVKKNKKEKK